VPSLRRAENLHSRRRPLRSAASDAVERGRDEILSTAAFVEAVCRQAARIHRDVEGLALTLGLLVFCRSEVSSLISRPNTSSEYVDQPNSLNLVTQSFSLGWCY
jgi:hypothetical protein